jgi:hypothetical protein
MCVKRNILILLVCSLFAGSSAWADEPTFTFFYDEASGVTTLRALYGDTTIGEVQAAGRLPNVVTLDGLSQYAKARTWAQLRDVVAESQVVGASESLAEILVILGAYADTPVLQVPSGIAMLGAITHRGREWDATGHCKTPCNEQWCACEETIPDPVPEPPKPTSILIME